MPNSARKGVALELGGSAALLNSTRRTQNAPDFDQKLSTSPSRIFVPSATCMAGYSLPTGPSHPNTAHGTAIFDYIGEVPGGSM